MRRPTIKYAQAGLLTLLLSSNLFANNIVCDFERCEQTSNETEELIPEDGFSFGRIHEVVDDILQVSGLEPNFEIRIRNSGNAAALIRNEKRFLVYNPAWMESLKGDSRSQWRLYGVLAHEIGHHLQGHTIDAIGSRPPTELEADSYAGFVLAGLGASLAEAQSLWQTLPARGSFSHPPRDQRLVAVKKGWDRWQRLVNGYKPKSQPRSQPLPQPSSQPSHNQSGIVLAMSNLRQLTTADVSGFNRTKLRLARNEIFARHGYIFHSPELAKWFGDKPWYTPSTRAVNLSPIERYNVGFLRNLERQPSKTNLSVKSQKHDWLLPHSSNRLITKSELRHYSRSELRFVRNEIFARHGYIFSSQDLNRYFSSKSWYRPITKQVNLSEIESANVKLIKSLER